MDAAIARTARRTGAALLALLLIGACGGPGLSKFDSDYFWAPSADEKKKTDWWDGFYGRSDSSDNCSFYGTCKDSGSVWGSGGGGAWGGGPSDSTSGSDAGGGF